MTVSGVAPPSTAALANATALQGAEANASASVHAGKSPDAAQVKQFDGLMQASNTGTGAGTGVQSMTPTSAAQQTQQTPPVSTDVRMTPADANRSSLVERLRTFTNDLDTRYSGLQKHQEQMLTSMSQNTNDPLMSMAQAMDFQWSATTTISEYQLSLAVAQATNGLTHSILKNQE